MRLAVHAFRFVAYRDEPANRDIQP
jgi:hypothetical protein